MISAYRCRKEFGGLLERDERRYACRQTDEGSMFALFFLFFHKGLCGLLLNSRFHHESKAGNKPNSKLEAADPKADSAVENKVNR